MENDGVVRGVLAGIDLTPLVAALERRSAELVGSVRDAVRTAVGEQDTRALLTLTRTGPTGARETLVPAARADYAKALLAFVRSTDDTLSCAVEKLVERAAAEAVIAFYESDAAVGALTAQISAAVRAESAVAAMLTDHLRDLRDTRVMVSGPLGVAAATTTVAAAPAKLLVGKAVLGSATASALHGTTAAAGKQAAATAAVKGGIAKAVGLAGGHLILGPVMVAIVGAVLVHEYRRFPGKLADRVSGVVAADLAARASGLHREFLVGYAREATGLSVRSFRRLADHLARHGVDTLSEIEIARLVDEFALLEAS